MSVSDWSIRSSRLSLRRWPETRTGKPAADRFPCVLMVGLESRRKDLNLRPTLYESVALPTELRRHAVGNWLEERAQLPNCDENFSGIAASGQAAKSAEKSRSFLRRAEGISPPRLSKSRSRRSLHSQPCPPFHSPTAAAVPASRGRFKRIGWLLNSPPSRSLLKKVSGTLEASENSQKS